MKKLLKSLLIVFVSVIIVSCSSGITSNTPKEFPVEKLIRSGAKQYGDVDGRKEVKVDFHYFLFTDGVSETFSWSKSSRMKLYEMAEVEPWDIGGDDMKPFYSLVELLDIKGFPQQNNLSAGDIVTFKLVVKEGVNLTMEQVEETLGTKFIPYEYTVK